jgi:hypothetical protein
LLSRRIALLTALVAALALSLAASTASASRSLIKGIYDEANTLYGDPPKTFPILRQLNAGAIRVNMYWGGRFGIANTKPTTPTDPADPAYEWGIYDRTVQYAAEHRIKVVFSIVGTPRWANGGRAPRYAPTNALNLQQFATAAARRYSGSFVRAEDGLRLPPVRHWLAWNEPNNPVFLWPQWQGRRQVSGRNYAKICNAVVRGIRAARLQAEKIACGVTAPRGNNNPTSSRVSTSPLAFMRSMKAGGAAGFDAYAHHPYYGKRAETPSTRPPNGNAVTLGNIGVLDKEMRRLWGNKRIWITEYAYQTKPDRLFAVTYAQQATYMRQAWAIAKRHPRIDMFLWFMLKDDTNIPIGWQSGVMTARWAKKPSFNVFRALK